MFVQTEKTKVVWLKHRQWQQGVELSWQTVVNFLSILFFDNTQSSDFHSKENMQKIITY